MTMYSNQRLYFTTIRLTFLLLIFVFQHGVIVFFFFFFNVHLFRDNDLYRQCTDLFVCLYTQTMISWVLKGNLRLNTVKGRGRGNNIKRRCGSSIRWLPLHLSRSPANIPGDTRGGEQVWKNLCTYISNDDTRKTHKRRANRTRRRVSSDVFKKIKQQNLSSY